MQKIPNVNANVVIRTLEAVLYELEKEGVMSIISKKLISLSFSDSMLGERSRTKLSVKC